MQTNHLCVQPVLSNFPHGALSQLILDVEKKNLMFRMSRHMFDVWDRWDALRMLTVEWTAGVIAQLIIYVSQNTHTPPARAIAVDDRVPHILACDLYL